MCKNIVQVCDNDFLAVCAQSCQNGGLCVADAYVTRCRCKAGYAGTHCEIGTCVCSVQNLFSGLCVLKT